MNRVKKMGGRYTPPQRLIDLEIQLASVKKQLAIAKEEKRQAEEDRDTALSRAERERLLIRTGMFMDNATGLKFDINVSLLHRSYQIGLKSMDEQTHLALTAFRHALQQAGNITLDLCPDLAVDVVMTDVEQILSRG